jgi:LysR family transcriptional regulator, glycine cleavage system transcriptional activator
MDRSPSLKAVHYFSVAARLKSFTAAATELNVTQGAVSRMVQSLERDLNVSLFERNGRFITLTSDGERYAGEVHQALQIIQKASSAVRSASSKGPLSLVVTTGFATRWLVPRLSDFHRAHPDISVEILGNEPDDPAYGSRAQIVVRYGQPPWRGHIATRLPLGELGVVCAPELATRAQLNGPEDLFGHPLLTHTADERDLWREYFANYNIESPDLGHGPRFNQLLMLAEAAVSGLGYALVPLFLYESELNAGRLVQVIPHTFASCRGYFITHAPAADEERKIRLFKNWLVKTAQECSAGVKVIGGLRSG